MSFLVVNLVILDSSLPQKTHQVSHHLSLEVFGKLGDHNGPKLVSCLKGLKSRNFLIKNSLKDWSMFIKPLFFLVCLGILDHFCRFLPLCWAINGWALSKKKRAKNWYIAALEKRGRNYHSKSHILNPYHASLYIGGFRRKSQTDAGNAPSAAIKNSVARARCVRLLYAALCTNA
jgi:hypothetical protein